MAKNHHKFVMKKLLMSRANKCILNFVFFSLGVFFSPSCGEKNKENDIPPKKGEAVYIFNFKDVDEKLISNEIRPHFAGLYGDRYKTIQQRPILGGKYKVFLFVKLDDKSITKQELLLLNRKVLQSLRKEVSYELDLKIGM